MAKTKDPEVVDGTKAAPGVLKECPKCHSTVWQGPHLRGPVVDGVFKASEELYSCMGCHAVMPIADMQDRVSLAAEL